jgi:nitroreductase
MQTLKLLKKRRSFRSFNAKEITAKTIKELIDCARLAPSARNTQPWEFVAVTNPQTLQTLGALIENARFISQCSSCIVVLCQDTKYYLEDGCAATENILLAAADLGVAGCWVAGDKKEYAREVLQLLNAPAGLKLVSLVALGYSDNKAAAPAKKALKEVLHWEKF